jgi:hypothetical protein
MTVASLVTEPTSDCSTPTERVAACNEDFLPLSAQLQVVLERSSRFHQEGGKATMVQNVGHLCPSLRARQGSTLQVRPSPVRASTHGRPSPNGR